MERHGNCHSEPAHIRTHWLQYNCEPFDPWQDSSSTAPSLADFCPGGATLGQLSPLLLLLLLLENKHTHNQHNHFSVLLKGLLGPFQVTWSFQDNSGLTGSIEMIEIDVTVVIFLLLRSQYKYLMQFLPHLSTTYFISGSCSSRYEPVSPALF